MNDTRSIRTGGVTFERSASQGRQAHWSSSGATLGGRGRHSHLSPSSPSTLRQRRQPAAGQAPLTARSTWDEADVSASYFELYLVTTLRGWSDRDGRTVYTTAWARAQLRPRLQPVIDPSATLLTDGLPRLLRHCPSSWSRHGDYAGHVPSTPSGDGLPRTPGSKGRYVQPSLPCSLLPMAPTPQRLRDGHNGLQPRLLSRLAALILRRWTSDRLRQVGIALDLTCRTAFGNFLLTMTP
jgi:hypothetical protein